MHSHFRRSITSISTIAFAFVALTSASACRGRRIPHTPTARGGGPAATLDDGQIAGVVGALHSAVIEQASVAQDRARDDRVALFADRLVMQHASAGQQVNAVFAGERVEQTQSGTSRGVVDQSRTTMHALSSTQPGPSFDRAYMESAARQLEQALSLYNGSLVNGVDGDARAALSRDRTAMQRQLTDARGILATLPAASNPAPTGLAPYGRDVTTLRPR